MLPTDLGRLDPRFPLLQNSNNLLLGEMALFHLCPPQGFYTPENSTLSWYCFRGAGHAKHITFHPVGSSLSNVYTDSKGPFRIDLHFRLIYSCWVNLLAY